MSGRADERHAVDGFGRPARAVERRVLAADPRRTHSEGVERRRVGPSVPSVAHPDQRGGQQPLAVQGQVALDAGTLDLQIGGVGDSSVCVLSMRLRPPKDSGIVTASGRETNRYTPSMPVTSTIAAIRGPPVARRLEAGGTRRPAGGGTRRRRRRACRVCASPSPRGRQRRVGAERPVALPAERPSGRWRPHGSRRSVRPAPAPGGRSASWVPAWRSSSQVHIGRPGRGLNARAVR